MNVTELESMYSPLQFPPFGAEQYIISDKDVRDILGDDPRLELELTRFSASHAAVDLNGDDISELILPGYGVLVACSPPEYPTIAELQLYDDFVEWDGINIDDVVDLNGDGLPDVIYSFLSGNAMSLTKVLTCWCGDYLVASD